MKIELTNVGRISHADVCLNGLTVIAGPNDSGKSTVGKTLFTTIKAMVSAKNRSFDNQLSRIKKLLYALYNRLGQEVLQTGLPSSPDECARTILSLSDKDSVEEYFKSVSQNIAHLDVSPQIKQLCQEDLTDIYAIIDGISLYILKPELNYMIKTEFMNNFTSVGKEISFVSLKFGKEKPIILSFEPTKDRICFWSYDSQICNGDDFDFDEFDFDDVTYIESPLYMHMLNSILNSARFVAADRGGLKYQGSLPAHIYDLAEKLCSVSYNRNGMNAFHVTDTMKGAFSFDQNTHQLLFTRENNTFPVVNVASGLKTFGIIQLLLQNGAINAKKLLIWDEPENHLHPEWQLNFALLLVQMAAAGFPILITTHSPYFLQAIRYYAAQQKMEKYVNYYTTKDEDEQQGLKVMQDVTNNLNEVFVSLAEPLNRIMNVDLAREQK